METPHAPKKKPNVSDVRIAKDYFRVMLDRGMALETVCRELESTGFSKTLVAQVAEDFKGYVPSTKKKIHKGVFIGFLVVCLAVALYVLLRLL